MSKVQVFNDGAVNFYMQSTLTAKRSAQGDWQGDKGWVLFLWRETNVDAAAILDGLSKQEARRLAKAWCKVNPYKD